MSQEIIHVAIVEDDEEIRQSLALIIKGTSGYYCKHTFVDGPSALKELPNVYANVILMDIELPGMSGIEVIKALKPQLPAVDFLMLTVKQDAASIFASLCAGASGYLMKDTPPSEILQSITEVHAGGAPMSTAIARQVVNSFQKKPLASPLSSRETEILQLL